MLGRAHFFEFTKRLEVLAVRARVARRNLGLNTSAELARGLSPESLRASSDPHGVCAFCARLASSPFRLLWVLVACLLAVLSSGRALGLSPDCLCGGANAGIPKPALRTSGTYSALVIFAKFSGEAPAAKTAPEWAPDLFDPFLPGSFVHFYDEMSRGALRVDGRALPHRYQSRDVASAYVASSPNELGDFGRFNLEILRQADLDADFGQFDNDGPDGVPNSGDDDGYVDVVFINLLTVPRNFLVDQATGYASLNLDTDYVSDDPAAGGGYVRVRNRFSGFGGTTQRGHTFSITAATMCHEFGHVLGLVDLFDQSTIGADAELDPAEESAGIGKWGLMGLGTLGWGVEDGPNAFSAWSLVKLGWVQVIDITEDVRDLVIPDAIASGQVYRIPVSEEEYFLLEGRQGEGSYYNRNVPASGLLIWHVDEGADNDEERHKQVDLVCADGLFADRGYPGEVPDAVGGGDNLDFYARDPVYAANHNGNTGDATDPFDGSRFTRFAHDTNPRCAVHTGFTRSLPLGVVVDSIRARGDVMVANVQVRAPLEGHVTRDTTWSGNVDVIGDVVIEPGVTLTLASGTVVRFPSFDWKATGFDPKRCELLVYGRLDSRGTSTNPVILTPTTSRGQWGGVFLMNGQNPDLRAVTLRRAVHGVVRQRLPAGITRWSGVQRVPMDLAVPADAELIMEPGAVVYFGLDLSRRGIAPLVSELIVDGRLTVAGTAGNPVACTSDPAEKDAIWYGIRMAPTARVDLRNLELQRAGYGVSGQVNETGFLRIVDSVIGLNAASGVRLTVNGSAVIERSQLIRNRFHGLRAEGSGRVRLTDVDVLDNGREGIYLGNASMQGEQVQVRGNGVLQDDDPRSGVRAVGGCGESIELADTEVADNALHGLDLHDWEGDVRLSGGTLTQNQGDGLRALAAAATELRGTEFTDNAEAGAVLRTGRVSIAEAHFAGNGLCGLELGTGSRGRILGSTFERGDGVVLSKADSILVQENRFATDAVGMLSRSAPATIRLNRFRSNQTGLQTEGEPLPALVELNVFLENRVAVDNRAENPLSAGSNYWGVTDSAAVAAMVRGSLVWTPILTAEPDPTAVLDQPAVPTVFRLGAVYPNPFNGRAVWPFELPVSMPIKIAIFDVLGRPVRELVPGQLGAGAHRVSWDGRDARGAPVASGVYVYRFCAGEREVSGRVVVLH